MWQALFILVSALVLQYIAAHSIIRKPDVEVAYHRNTDRNCESDEHKFQMILGQSLSDCVIECALREHCAVMNYQSVMTLCELYKEVGNTVPNSAHRCTSVLKNDIHLIKSPCNNNNTCPYRQACDRTSRTCISKECLDVPDVENGKVVGNMKNNGSKIRYKCNRGYKNAVDSSRTAVCDNGKWSNHGHCVSADGGWSSWSDWSSCPASCEGVQTRSRSCTNPAPQNGGNECPGDESENKNCTADYCTVNGEWTVWSTWSSCSSTCGVGSQTRTRTCTNPATQIGADNCTGAHTENDSCNIQPCTVTDIPFRDTCSNVAGADQCKGDNTECSGGTCQCVSDYYWNGDECVQKVGVGEECTGTACLDGNSTCVRSTENNRYCHCSYGFEFNETLGVCDKVCNEYSNDTSEFEAQRKGWLVGYNCGDSVQTDSFQDCVNNCSLNFPQFLSICFKRPDQPSFGDAQSGKCWCKKISEQQYIKAHGALKNNNKYSFCNRPCKLG